MTKLVEVVCKMPVCETARPGTTTTKSVHRQEPTLPASIVRSVLPLPAIRRCTVRDNLLTSYADHRHGLHGALVLRRRRRLRGVSCFACDVFAGTKRN